MIAATLTQGMQLLQAGQLALAEQAFFKVLAMDGENSHARFALGITCYQSDRLNDAERYLQETISRSPNFLPAYNNLSLVYKALGNSRLAIEVLDKALAIEPNYVDAIYNLALIHEESGDTASAIALYRRVIERKADFLRAHTNLGLLLRASGDVANAHRHLNIVATQTPQDVFALVNLALVLTDLGRFAEAIAAGTRAAQLAPENVDAWEALGNAQRLAGDANAAIKSLQRALQLNPASVELQYELGLAQGSAGELEAAQTTLNTVARLRPEWLKVLFARDLALPTIYLSDQHIADSKAAWTSGIACIEARLLESSPRSIQESVEAISGYAPFYLHYQGLDNTDLQRRFGGVVSTVAARAWPQFAQPVALKPCAHGSRLRVGFVSAYLRQHSVGHFFGNWIYQLDTEKFESFVWYTGEAADEITEKIRARATHFFHTPFDISALAKTIHANQVDILIYLDVGMHPASQVLAALRLAPIQCAAFGHPVTTGLDSIDYFLSADAAEPLDAASHYAEKLIRLPRFAISYARPDVSRQRTPSTLTSSQRPLILCAQPLFKILPHFDRLAARIARALPGCRLVFIESLWPRVNSAFFARISAVLQEAGIDPLTTLQMLPIMPYEEYLGALNAADVILDTPGFSGGNSSFDAIAVGAPVVSHRGQMLRARQTAAMLDIIGLGEFASEADDDFVRNAISIASSKDRQREIRERMKTGSNALFGDCETVRALESQLIKLAKSF